MIPQRWHTCMNKYVLSLLLVLMGMSFSAAQKIEERRIGDEFRVKMINDLVVAPNGKSSAFAAVGKVKVLDHKKSKLKDLTKSKSNFEYEPSYSKDSKRIVFASWNDSGFGKLHYWDKGTNWTQTVSITSGIYRTPSFSPDGLTIVYKKEIEVGKVDTTNQKTEGLYIMPIKNGDPTKISDYGESPIFSVDGKRIIYQSGTYRFGSFVKTFEQVDLEGNNKEILFYGKFGHEYSISPDFKMVAWQELGTIYVAPFPLKPVGLSADNKNINAMVVAKLPGNNLSWSDDNKALSWNIADDMYTAQLDRSMTLKKKKIEFIQESDKPEGVLAFTNARIVTMEGDEVLEHATLIVRGNQIEDIGFDIQVPKEAHAINCSGKTIMPGLIDLNPTSNNYDYNLSPIQGWEYIELLKSGITTKLDGGFKIKNGLINKDLVAAGKLTGPRLLNGGITIAPMDENTFTKDSYDHYKRSNLMIAESFGAIAVQSDIDLKLDNMLQLDNVQNDTSKITSEDLYNVMISKSEDGADVKKILHKYTLHNAKLIGLSSDIGSIKKGKLADIIIIDGNPLQDLSNISKIRYTVVNGRIYDTSTMEEVGNYRKRISRTSKTDAYESLNRAMGSSCCGFQH